MTLSHKLAELKRVLRRAESGQVQLKAATQVRGCRGEGEEESEDTLEG